MKTLPASQASLKKIYDEKGIRFEVAFKCIVDGDSDGMMTWAYRAAFLYSISDDGKTTYFCGVSAKRINDHRPFPLTISVAGNEITVIDEYERTFQLPQLAVDSFLADLKIVSNPAWKAEAPKGGASREGTLLAT